MEKLIPFNKPYFSGKELEYIGDAVSSGKISGDGKYTRLCHNFFEQELGFLKVLLTTSCTDALEMAAILIDIQEGDEIIMPAYTFVSTANAFVLRGAKIVFADSLSSHPNIDADKIEDLITVRTKAIVPVHYAGVGCDMSKIMEVANKYNLYVIEDAAQAIDSYYIEPDGTKRKLGSIGHLAAFSFHETKNIISGEGGMLVINDGRFIIRAEIIREKGTNRSSFFRGEVDKYGWVDLGSSFLPSDIIAAFLYAQLQSLEVIQTRRKEIWNLYYKLLQPLEEQGKIKLPKVFDYATNNGHMFYILCKNAEQRENIIKQCKEENVHPVFHYLSLNKSAYYDPKAQNHTLKYSDQYTDRLLRLPLFMELEDSDVIRVVNLINLAC